MCSWKNKNFTFSSISSLHSTPHHPPLYPLTSPSISLTTPFPPQHSTSPSTIPSNPLYTALHIIHCPFPLHSTPHHPPPHSLLLPTPQHSTSPSTMPIELHYMSMSAPCRATLLTVRQLELDVTLNHLDLLRGEHMTKEFIAMNPEHTVPTIVDGDFALWER